MKNIHTGSFSGRRLAKGLTLIELMIAMLLGLLVVGAAIAIFLSNRQAFRATENLGRVQETARVGFEMMVRDIRDSGGNACDFTTPVGNVINGAAVNWFTNWAQPVLGFENGTMPGGNLAGTDAIQVLSGGPGEATVVSHAAGSQTFTMGPAPAHGFVTGDNVIVCNMLQTSIFRVSNATATTVRHQMAGGNCSNTLGILPSACAGLPYTYTRNSIMSPLIASRWYIAANPRGGNSLYRNSGTAVEEIAEGVDNMQIVYLEDTAVNTSVYAAANAVANWGRVRGARIIMTLVSQDRVGTDGNPLTRTVVYSVSIRNRNL